MDGQEILIKKSYLKKNQKKYEDYCFVLPGYNLRPTNINAAIGLEQIKKLNKFIKIRNYNHKIFKNYLKMMRFIFKKLLTHLLHLLYYGS